MQPPEVSCAWQPRGDIVVRSIADQTLLVPVRGSVAELNSIYALDEVGALIWNRIRARSDRRHIIDALVEQFDVPLAKAEKDALEFIASLEAAGLVERCPESL